jgi:hypothetical protein
MLSHVAATVVLAHNCKKLNKSANSRECSKKSSIRKGKEKNNIINPPIIFAGSDKK